MHQFDNNFPGIARICAISAEIPCVCDHTSMRICVYRYVHMFTYFIRSCSVCVITNTWMCHVPFVNEMWQQMNASHHTHMYMCMYTHIYNIYIYIYIHTNIYIHIYIYYIYAYMWVYICVCTCIYKHVYLPFSNMYIYTCKYV